MMNRRFLHLIEGHNALRMVVTNVAIVVLGFSKFYTRPERIRLRGIDCPEKGQGFSNRAKQAVSQLAFGKDVTLQTHGHVKYGRTRAEVFLPDGMNLNRELPGACGTELCTER